MRRMSILGVFLAAAILAPGVFHPLVGEAAEPVHQDVWLKNELGERITPAGNASDPYSPKKSCGTCHGYATITKGYHFQQGFDEMGDRYDAKKPWRLSPGMYGNWLPYSAAGRIAAKVNREARQIDLSAYDFIGNGKIDPATKARWPACGWCHPGGGPLEYGRNGEGRADLSRNLARLEAGKQEPLDGDFTSRAAPDGRSHFRESGVVEADCLICHLPGYRMDDRNGQLAARNYRWAATAGAGLGRIQGAVFTPADPAAGPGDPNFFTGKWNFSKRPVVTYGWKDRKLFTAEGKLQGRVISGRVGTKNCLQCHGEWGRKDTGTIHAAPHDAHAKAGLTCTDCHPLVGKTAEERLGHQIAKGSHPQIHVRDDLDGVGMKSCLGCHKQGQYRPTRSGMPKAATDPARTHAEKFPGALFHTALITCAACHVTAQPAKGMALLDLTTGEERGFTAEAFEAVTRAGDDGRARQPWKPWIARGRGQQGYGEAYFPHVPKGIQWFGERTVSGEIRPIALHQVRQAFLGLKGGGTGEVRRSEGAKGKVPFLSDQELLRMVSALTARGFKNVVYVADRVYEVSEGKLIAGKQPIAADSYPVAHGVVPLEGRAVYGSKGKPEGCSDCHDKGAAFFTKLQVVNVREFIRHDSELKAPQALPQMNEWGITRVPPAQ